MISTKIGENTKWTVAQDSPIPNNIMYAQPIAGQSQVTTDANGKTVANLQFTPYATTLHMTFAGWKRENNQLTANMTELTVFSVTVTAPGTSRDITGDFTLSLKSDGSAPTTSNSQVSIEGNKSAQVKLGTANMNGISLKEKDTFECDLFLIPNAGTSISDQWELTLETSSGNYTRTLTPSGNAELLPGQIHRMEFPAISVKNDWVYTPKSWLADIPDNVYWSEVSLPGSWYSASNTNKDLYQNGTIAQQFAAGVRAFHLETKVGWASTIATEGNSNKKNVVISGSGQNTGTTVWNATAIASTIDQIAAQLTSDSEYAVLTLSYADGGRAGMEADDLAAWLQKVNDTFDPSKATSGTLWGGYNGFKTISASTKAKLFTGKLDVNTPVSALRGKLLVLLNVQTRNTASTGYTPGNFLYAYTHSNWTETALQVSQAYWKTWSNEYLTSASGKAWEQNPNSLYFNYTFANRTQLDSGTEADLPTYAKRKEAIQSIITRSKKMRGDGRHNILFFIGAGGTEAITSSGDATDNGPTLVADQLNGYLLGEINKKIEAGEASPLGLVYTNFTTGTSGQQVVDAIIRMNRRFKLLEIGGTQGGGTGTQTNIKSVIPTHSSGYNKAAGNGWNAF